MHDSTPGRGVRRWVALGAAVALALVLPGGQALADDGESVGQGGPPDLRVVLHGGWAYHFGKTTVDTVSGATQKVDGADRADHGGAVGVGIDLGLLPLGPGDLGLTGSYTYSGPDAYHDANASLRYRMHFATPSIGIDAVEPFVGLGATFAFADDLDDDFFLLFPTVSLGCDVTLPIDGLFVGVEVVVNAINPVGVETTLTVDGHDAKASHRMDEMMALLRVGYQLF